MNFFAYRLPGASEPVMFEAEEASPVSFSAGRPGFIVAPFSPDDPSRFYALRTPLASFPHSLEASFQAFPSITTSTTPTTLTTPTLTTSTTSTTPTTTLHSVNQGDYAAYISEIKRRLGGREDWKIVASRREVCPLSAPPSMIFTRLCRAYPEAFVFFFSSPDFGAWIGASPELLLEKRGPVLHTMALAGTRPASSPDAEFPRPWDQKNILEQRIVTDSIVSAFEAQGLSCRVAAPRTLRAGTVEHIMTAIEAQLHPCASLPGLLRDLSPTPALAGFPRDLALKTIAEFEGDRLLYGGYCGPVDASGDFRLSVILRCALLSPAAEGPETAPPSAVLFAGGGITARSSASEEWRETSAKLSTLRPHL